MPGVFTSFLTPLYTGKLDRECTLCGIFGKQKLCSRCKLVRYCSNDCQKEDWKRHRSECTDPSKLQLNECDYLEIDPSKSTMELDGNVMCTFSCSESSAKGSHMTQDDIAKWDNTTVGEFKVWKVQVPMQAGLNTSGIMIYTKNKENLIHVVPEMLQNGVDGYRKLYKLVKEKGDDGGYCMGGLKVFVYGVLTVDKKLQLNVEKVVPLQPW